MPRRSQASSEGGLQDDLKPDFQRRQWPVQRVLWALGALVILAAIVGLFGGGPLSEASKSVEREGVTFEVDYNRWNRQKSSQSLEVSVEGATGNDLSVQLGGDLANDIEVETVFPEPDSTSLREDGPVYSWALEDGGNFVVRFEYRAERILVIDGDVTISAGGQEETLSFNQFIFP